MSNTTTINPAATQGNRKKNYGAAAAIATGVAGAGAAAAIYSNIDDISEIEEIAEMEETAAENITEDPMQATNHPGTPQQTAGGGGTATSSQSSQATAQTSSPENATEANATNVVEPAPIDQTSGQTQPTQQTQVTEQTQVNPDDVAEAIIAEEMIDPNDIDMADIVDFDEIMEVYTVDGENFTAASFHDIGGNQMMMIDLDDDDVFDIVTDANGIPFVDQDGNFISADNITVDDVEMDITGSNTYLGHNPGEHTHEFGMESISEDILT